jgi:hypothetical protein
VVIPNDINATMAQGETVFSVQLVSRCCMQVKLVDRASAMGHCMGWGGMQWSEPVNSLVS